MGFYGRLSSLDVRQLIVEPPIVRLDGQVVDTVGSFQKLRRPTARHSGSVVRASFDQQHRPARIFGQTGCQHASRTATASDSRVVLVCAYATVKHPGGPRATKLHPYIRLMAKHLRIRPPTLDPPRSDQVAAGSGRFDIDGSPRKFAAVRER